MDLTGTDSPKSNKHGPGSLARSLESRVFARWMSYMDTILIIIGSPALMFGTLAFVAEINIRAHKLMMKDEAELDMESWTLAWRMGDGNNATIIGRYIDFDFSPQFLFCTVPFLYVTSSVIPLLAAFALHQSASEKPTQDIKSRIFLVKIWLTFNLIFTVMTLTAGVVVDFPKFLYLCLAIVGLRFVMTIFVIMYFAELQDAAEEGSAVQTFNNRFPALVEYKKRTQRRNMFPLKPIGVRFIACFSPDDHCFIGAVNSNL